MTITWTPRPPLRGAAVFLSASVPSLQRDGRFLRGPLEDWLMLRVIDQRLRDAVQALVAELLAAGGRLVHGGHPTITPMIAAQCGSWVALDEEGSEAEGREEERREAERREAEEGSRAAEPMEPPVLLYQSERFRQAQAPQGRETMQRSGIAAVRWSAAQLEAMQIHGAPWADRLELDPAWIAGWLPEQAPKGAAPELQQALLAMRLQMLLESQPTAAVCIGGMEGIEAEARLYSDLCRHGLLPGSGVVHVLGSTFGAAAQLAGVPLRMLDQRPPSSSATAREDLLERLTYDGVMRQLIRDLTAANEMELQEGG